VKHVKRLMANLTQHLADLNGSSSSRSSTGLVWHAVHTHALAQIPGKH
jgi:hypothetical protein